MTRWVFAGAVLTIVLLGSMLPTPVAERRPRRHRSIRSWRVWRNSRC